MNRKGCILSFKSSLPLIFVSHLISHVSRKRGFTVVEFLVSILISLLILGAISVAFIGANREFQQNKPISQAIQEAQNSVATLDFLFSRWGVGMPSLNNIPIYIMDYDGTIEIDRNGNPINWQPASLSISIIFPPANSFWHQVTDTNGDGKNDTIEFYASLGGTGYVTDCPNNNSCNILSCRLTSDSKNRCYFIFSADGTSIKYYVLGSSDLTNDNIDCLNLQNNQTSNTTINVGGLSPGDRFQRVPHLIKIYEMPIDSKTSWLAFDRIDLADDCNDNENATYIGRIKRGSFQVRELRGQNGINVGANANVGNGINVGANVDAGKNGIGVGADVDVGNAGSNANVGNGIDVELNVGVERNAIIAVEVQADFVDENGNVAYKFKKVYAK